MAPPDSLPSAVIRNSFLDGLFAMIRLGFLQRVTDAPPTRNAVPPSLADLSAMRLWGAVSDKVHNKAVIQACSRVTLFLPLAWTFVRPGQLLFPLLLHILGGAFWAGINLCTSNLVLSITPREERAICFSVHNIAAGLAVHLLDSFDLGLLRPFVEAPIDGTGKAPPRRKQPN